MRSHLLEFSHPDHPDGALRVSAGADQIGWGYGLNTAKWNTYQGEVVQILSCYVDDLMIRGTIRNYREMERIYTWFLKYMQIASQGRTGEGVAGERRYNQEPVTFKYPHRGWTFHIVPTAVPGYRKGRDVVAPTWELTAHVVDEEGDVDSLKDLVIQEAELKARVHSNDPNFDEHFGLEGVIRFVDENPFSDPVTEKGFNFSGRIKEIGDWYTKLLPTYLKGDFDALTGNLGSKPAFGNTDPTKNVDTDQGQNATPGGTAGQQKKADRTRNTRNHG